MKTRSTIALDAEEYSYFFKFLKDQAHRYYERPRDESPDEHLRTLIIAEYYESQQARISLTKPFVVLNIKNSTLISIVEHIVITPNQSLDKHAWQTIILEAYDKIYGR